MHKIKLVKYLNLRIVYKHKYSVIQKKNKALLLGYTVGEAKRTSISIRNYVVE